MIRPDSLFRPRLLVLLLVAACASLPSISAAQSTPAAATPEILDSRIRDTEHAAGVDETTRETLLELYRKTAGLISQQHSFEQAAEEFTGARETAPRQARVLRRELAKLEMESASELAPREGLSKSLGEQEQRLLSEKANLAALTARLADFDATLDGQSHRSSQARARLNEAGRREQAVAQELQKPAPEGEPPLLVEARRWALQQEAMTLAAEVAMLNQELLSQPMRAELLSVQRDMTTLQLQRLADSIEILEDRVAQSRRDEAISAKEATAETRRLVAGKPPPLQSIAELNAELSETLNQLAKSLERVTNDKNETGEQVRRVSEYFRLARQKLEIAGLSQALGQVLLEQSQGLPKRSFFRKAEAQQQRRVVVSSLRQIRHQEERAQLRDIGNYVDMLLIEELPSEQARLRGELLALAEVRRDLLDKAIAADDSYLQALGEHDFALRQLSETVTAYGAFLDERLLWIRSGEPLSLDIIASIGPALAIYFSAENWRDFGRVLVTPGASSWILGIGLVLFVGLQIASRRIRAALRECGVCVGQLRHDKFTSTLRALGWTLLMALAWPVLFFTMGLHVLGSESGSIFGHYSQSLEWKGQFAPAIGYALYRVALIAFFFRAFYAFCKPYGLAVVHFRWNPANAELLADEIRRLAFIFIPIGLILASSTLYDPAELGGGLSRLCVLAAMLALAWFLGRTLAPLTGAARDFYAANPDSLLTWFRYLWLGLGLALPGTLAGLAMAGYVYTATQFGLRVVNMLWLMAAIIFIHQLIVRWVLLTERRLAFRAALQKHRQQRAAREATGPEDSDGEAATVPEPEIDIAALSEDTTSLINSALTLVAVIVLWVIWTDALPAFRILDEISLWHYSAVVAGAETLVPVTLNDLILGLLVVVVGAITARRLPALLEIILLGRLNITPGSLYAIATLTQYTIVAVGVVLVFKLLGGSWSEIQWLIAALGVGIGFGLQEIVANFISGIILLFERPIRIGDIVTVGDTDGEVTGIRIRSTTIRNWDGKELLVPNKEFITGRLLNWTLSDSVTRIVIPVGIAYGSDVTLAIRMVREAADENEHVLDEPRILVTLENFGESALTIMLRCFIGSMDHRVDIVSQLNQSIYSKFKQAGIVIAYPQRDIHLDTSKPLDLRIHKVTEENDKPDRPGPESDWPA